MSTTTGDLLKKAAARRALPAPGLRRAIRESAGISRHELADALGVQETTVWRWEAGQREPRGDLLIRYVTLLRQLEGIAA